MFEFTLGRKQSIIINGETTIKVLNVTAKEKVFLGITAPRHVNILRENAKRKKPGTDEESEIQSDDAEQTTE
ncbi:carbon storage regulator [Aliamphritea spongicola]|uniref:carbon storage regulator n=1 Tax=Aliamphritea spongicola TaxID=707589 RepID=UPI00196B88BE|nr:carbon storage regulator [Aliamphritea spongicola]MBN3563188.1 carbon storage regulator [Aliamphritea spongicola]